MGFLRAILILFASMLTVSTASMHPLSDEFIEYINSKQTTWRAGRNFPSNTPLEDLKKLADVYPDVDAHSLPRIEHDADIIEKLPNYFDPRQKWSCRSLHEIRDMGSCKSSRAFAAVEAMTDRVCIQSNGSREFHFSAEDLISCCKNCGGCQEKGYLSNAWTHWKDKGIVSGGNYNSSQGCRPYSFPPCKHHAPLHENLGSAAKTQKLCRQYVKTPKCTKKCYDNSKNRTIHHLSYKKDKNYGKRIYYVSTETNIKAELRQNGPVTATFWLYTDFFHYKRGVYQYTGGDLVGKLAVKLMGWGVEYGKKYWLAANSWNYGWGNNGFFKILRGVNHLNITSNVVAGTPRLKN